MSFKMHDNDIFDPGYVLRGNLVVEARDRAGNLLWTRDLGPNAIMPRSRLVGSRLFAQFMKSWAAAAFHADWTTYAGQDYLGGVDVGSYNYPFSEQITGLPANNLVRLDAFGGVPTHVDTITGEDVSFGGLNQNIDHAFHHGSAVAPGIDAALLYSLGITGMCFGNMGHLVNPTTLNIHPNDVYSITLDDYVFGVDDDIATLPAEPWDPLALGTHGYTWPGGGVLARYPNLHQPNAFLYEPVINGIVPWGYAGLATVQDNQFAVPAAIPALPAAYEGNTTLYSETARFPLDKGDGITFPDGNCVRFKCTIPADCELNQERLFGYGRRPRFWITEAGLISGENLIVQSPDQRTFGPMEPMTTGVSNIYGGFLCSNSHPESGVAFKSLPKDYFTRLRDPATATWFLDPVGGQIIATENNTWNMVARKVFGVVTKTQAVAYSFLWTLSFG